jgi:hypothetical protein
MSSSTLQTESANRTASPATDHRRTQRADTAQDALTARPDGTRSPRVPDQTAAVPTGLCDKDTAQASSGLTRGYQRIGANALALLGLAGVAGAGWTAAVLGELDYIRTFITQSTGFITYSATGPAYTPSVDGFLGLAFMGPYGAIFAASLGICACLGVLALRKDRRSSGLVGKALPLGAALLLPLLVVNYTILLAVEMAGAHWMPASLLENPSRLGAWVAAALIGAAAIGLTSNGLVLRWAWRREQRLAAS